MQRRMLTLVAVVALLVTSLGTGAPTLADPAGPSEASPDVPTDGPFPDVGEDHRFAEAIGWMADNGLSGGYPDGGYHPTAPVSRQAAAAFLARYAGHDTDLPACTTAPFPDVPASHQFCAEITWLTDEGVTAGYPDGRFHPTAPVSRQAMAAFLYRLRHATPTPTATCPEGPPFPDVATTNGFCGEIAWLTERDIAGGYPDGGFHPTTPVSRQAAASILHALDPGCTPATEHCPRPAIDGDYDGDRIGDPVYTRWNQEAGTTTWYRGGDPTPLASTPDHLQVDADYDGDGRWEIAWVDLDAGTWTTHGAAGTFTLAPPECDVEPGMHVLPVVGDFDHDGGDEPAWYCPMDGTWHLDDGTTIRFGQPYRVLPEWAPDESPSSFEPLSYHDAPVVLADDEGRDVPGTYRPTDGTFRRQGVATPVATAAALAAPLSGAPPAVWRPVGYWLERDGSAGWRPDGSDAFFPAPIDHDGDGVADYGAITSTDAGERLWEIDGAPDVQLVPSPGVWTQDIATTVPAATVLDLPRFLSLEMDCYLEEICPPGHTFPPGVPWPPSAGT